MQIVQQIASLATTTLHRAVATRDELVAPARARRPGDLALEHQRTQRLLGGIVGRLNARMIDEAPQGGPQLEQVCTGVGRATADLLGGAGLKGLAQAALDRLELRMGGHTSTGEHSLDEIGDITRNEALRSHCFRANVSTVRLGL